MSNKKAIFAAAFLMVAIFFSWAFWYFALRQDMPEDPYKLTMDEAGKVGETKTAKLLVQVAPSREGRFERGDIVLVAAEDKEFSLAEKEGFLIINVFLTEKQQQLLLLSMRGEKEDESGRPVDIKRRKFTVDLEKIGIAPDDIKGKIISDKVFEDEVLIEKEN